MRLRLQPDSDVQVRDDSQHTTVAPTPFCPQTGIKCSLDTRRSQNPHSEIWPLLYVCSLSSAGVPGAAAHPPTAFSVTRRAMQWFWDQYLPDHEKRKEPTASPLLASTKLLEGLPRTLIVTAENDVLRDEGEAYGRKLIEAGVEVVMTRYNATIHEFLLLNALAASAPSRAAATQAIHFLQETLA